MYTLHMKKLVKRRIHKFKHRQTPFSNRKTEVFKRCFHLQYNAEQIVFVYLQFRLSHDHPDKGII